VRLSEDAARLLKRVQLKRFAESPPRKLLQQIMDEIELKTHQYARNNWEILIELLAHHEGIINETRHKELLEHLEKTNLMDYYGAAAKRDPWDYPGEIFQDLRLGGMGQELTPKPVIDLMLKMTFPEKITEVQTLLDPCVGSGRFLIEATNLYQDAPLILFGVEVDLWLYRACLVNMKMFAKHPYSIICADTLRLDPEKSGPASPIWDLGNRWEPPDITPFYWKPISPFQAYMKTKQGKE